MLRRHTWKDDEDGNPLECRVCGVKANDPIPPGPWKGCIPPTHRPNPECHYPAECNKTGRCPRDPVCFN